MVSGTENVSGIFIKTLILKGLLQILSKN